MVHYIFVPQEAITPYNYLGSSSFPLVHERSWANRLRILFQLPKDQNWCWHRDRSRILLISWPTRFNILWFSVVLSLATKANLRRRKWKKVKKIQLQNDLERRIHIVYKNVWCRVSYFSLHKCFVDVRNIVGFLLRKNCWQMYIMVFERYSDFPHALSNKNNTYPLEFSVCIIYQFRIK